MERWSSRPEESHPRALPDPCVNLSIHTAPDARPFPWHSCQCAKSVGFVRRSRSNQSRAPLVVDPASNARVVHLGQIWQGFVAAMMKRPAPDRSANERQRLRAGGGLEAVRRRHRQRRPPHTAFKETADEPGSFLTLYQTAHSESIVDRWHNFALRPCWSAARAASPSASVFSAFRSTTQRPAHLKLKGPA